MIRKLICLLGLAAIGSAVAFAQTQTSAGVSITPPATQTVVQPAGTSLNVNVLNGTFNEELYRGGSTVAAGVNAAVAACGSTNMCTIIIPPYAPFGQGWTTPLPNNVYLIDQRAINGMGFTGGTCCTGLRSGTFYQVYNGADRSFEKPSTVGAGLFAAEFDAHAHAGGTAGNGFESNSGGILILSEMTGGHRPIWGMDISMQYHNLSNSVNGIEIDDINFSGTDAPGNGTHVGINLIASSAGRASGVGMIIGGTGGSLWQNGITLNSYKDTGLVLDGSLTPKSKAADMYLTPNDDSGSAFIILTNHAKSAPVYTVGNNGSIFSNSTITGSSLKFGGIAPTTTANSGAIGWNQSGAQETDYINNHGSGAGGYRWFECPSPGTGCVQTEVLDQSGNVVFSGSVKSTSLQINGGASIANSNAIPQVGTPRVGQAACIKAAGPPAVIGYCSTAVSSTGSCTCN